MNRAEFLRRTLEWEKHGGAPIYVKENLKAVKKLVNEGIIRNVGVERIGPLGSATGNDLFVLTDKGKAELEESADATQERTGQTAQ